MLKKLYRGVWAGLTACTISKLMGCSHTTALTELKNLKEELSRGTPFGRYRHINI